MYYQNASHCAKHFAYTYNAEQCFWPADLGGNQAQFTASVFDSGTVVTAAMAATTAPSDRLSEGVALQSLYFLGLFLFVITLLLNLVADRFVRRVRLVY